MRTSGFALIKSLTLLLLLTLLAACGSTATSEIPTVSAVPSPEATTVPSTQTPTPQPPTTIPTSTSSPSPSRTPFPRSLDKYLLTYNPQATAKIPIQRPIGFGIWGNEIPVQPIEGEPQFIHHPPPAGLAPLTSDLLVQAGCDLQWEYFADCSAVSSLQQFGCTTIYPMEISFQQQEGLILMGKCGRSTQEDWLTPEDGIILSGCAFREKIGYLFQSEGEIILVNNLEDLRQLFAPIESDAEAVSYAQLATGLAAQFEITLDPYLVYLQDRIEDTRADPVSDGYRINLYHRPYCHCEPYVYSEIILQVNRDGTIDWISVIPFALTTGYSCAD